MDTILNNLKNRDQERLISMKNKSDKNDIVFIKHSSDVGVQRNGGRRGSEYGPSTIINHFQKLAAHSEKVWNEIETSNQLEEMQDFNLAQEKAIGRTAEALKLNQALKFVFLGGGHDHVYVDLEAVKKSFPTKKLCIINLDPHLDTRIDPFYNSGTPFRQLDKKEFKDDLFIQIGTEEFANVKSSKETFKHIKHNVYNFDLIKNESKNFTDNLNIISKIVPILDHNEYIYFLSIDLDAINSSLMEAVSAPNHRGVNFEFLANLIQFIKSNSNSFFTGFYEYNPLYENLSTKGARAIASLIYHL